MLPDKEQGKGGILRPPRSMNGHLNISDIHKESTRRSKGKFSTSTVKFDNITVREYSITIGDNPSCSGGAPMSIDWRYSEEAPLALDDFERTRSTKRRSKEDLHIPLDKRHEILNMCNCPFTKIVKASLEVSKIQESRARSRRRYMRQQAVRKTIGKFFRFSRQSKCDHDIDRINAEFFALYKSTDDDPTATDEASLFNEKEGAFAIVPVSD